MDPATISVTAAAAVTALQPYLPVIATKAAEKLGEGVPKAIGKLWATIRERMDVKEAAKEALEDLLADPQNERIQTVFEVQLEKMLAKDKSFLAKVEGLLADARQEGIIRARDVKVGSGAAAIGNNARAVGKGGMIVEGDTGGDLLGPGATKKGD